MTKILVLGMAPLPFEKERKIYGPGLRTWQLTKALLEEGHEILLLCYGIPSAYEKGALPREVESPAKELRYLVLNNEKYEDGRYLAGLARQFGPDCMVAVTLYPCYVAARLELDQPLWADLFGHVLGEAQARASVYKDDSLLFHYWNQEMRIIDRADVFSCVSQRQVYATIGELGLVGRLNRHTAGYRFAHCIPISIPTEKKEHDLQVLRGRDVSEDHFVILWSGGYNTWTDVDTLFVALEGAMKVDGQIRFVSTGGEIPELDDQTYGHFQELIKNSAFADRFILKGWVKTEEVHNYYYESDLGINIDRDIYEVELGSKNRIVEWMNYGLPVLSSRVCELTEILDEHGAGFTYPPGDAEALKDKILQLARDREGLREAGARGACLAAQLFSVKATTTALREWAADPHPAPDGGKERALDRSREEAFRNLEKIVQRQKEMIAERDARIRDLEMVFHRSPLYRLYGLLSLARKKVLRKG